jgi:hypothetical protein
MLGPASGPGSFAVLVADLQEREPQAQQAGDQPDVVVGEDGEGEAGDRGEDAEDAGDVLVAGEAEQEQQGRFLSPWRGLMSPS